MLPMPTMPKVWPEMWPIGGRYSRVHWPLDVSLWCRTNLRDATRNSSIVWFETSSVPNDAVFDNTTPLSEAAARSMPSKPWPNETIPWQRPLKPMWSKSWASSLWPSDIRTSASFTASMMAPRSVSSTRSTSAPIAAKARECGSMFMSFGPT